MRTLLKPGSYLSALALAAGLTIAAPAQAQAATTASASDRSAAADLATSRVGKTPYVYGGTSLTKGVDCSGLTGAVYRTQGVSLKRTAEQQRRSVRSTDKKWLRKGDLVFYGKPAYHVGVYVGNGYIVDAPSSGKKVSKRKMWSGQRTYGTLRPA